MIYLIITFITILYIIIGLVLFKIDIDYGSVILTQGCFNEGGGFELYFLLYATLWPVLLAITLIRLPKLIEIVKNK
jgi:hypothetical protein